MELQRLIARGPGCLPEHLVVDVAALLRWAEESRTTCVVDETYEAIVLSGRTALWVLGPTAVPHAAAASEPLKAAAAILGDVRLVRSGESCLSLLRRATADRLVAVVSAGLDDHPYELGVLAGAAVGVLDVATGRAWTAEELKRERGVAPSQLAELYAVAGDIVGLEPVVDEATRPENFVRWAQALAEGRSVDQASLPPRVKDRLNGASRQLEDRVALLRGEHDRDEGAAAEVRRWLQRPYDIEWVAGCGPVAADVVADVERPEDKSWSFRRVLVKVAGGIWQEAQGSACADLLRDLPTSCLRSWSAPRAMDLMATMVDAGLELPVRVFDPGLAAYCLDPDSPGGLQSSALLALDGVSREWLLDFRRESDGPPDIHRVARVLFDVEADALRVLGERGMVDLLRNDLGLTLPHLARLEREGFYLRDDTDLGDWPTALAVLDDEAESELRAAGVLTSGIDPFRAHPEVLLAAMTRHLGVLPASHCPPGRLESGQLRARYEELFPAAAALRRARALCSGSGVRYWVSRAAAGLHRLRGIQRPQATGRWGFGRHNIQGLPKQGAWGRRIRGALCGPPGTVLIAADWRAFEVRILSALSQDPELLDICTYPDPHEELRRRLGGPWTRDDVKASTYAPIYGQTRAGFVAGHAGLPWRDAERLYTAVEKRLAKSFACVRDLSRNYNPNAGVRTLGGWARTPEPRNAANTLIQGTGADLLRFVLRELGQALPTVGARVVHQAHDEVFIVVPNSAEKIQAAERILEQTMEGAGFESGLLPDTPLPAKVSRWPP